MGRFVLRRRTATWSWPEAADARCPSAGCDRSPLRRCRLSGGGRRRRIQGAGRGWTRRSIGAGKAARPTGADETRDGLHRTDRERMLLSRLIGVTMLSCLRVNKKGELPLKLAAIDAGGAGHCNGKKHKTGRHGSGQCQCKKRSHFFHLRFPLPGLNSFKDALAVWRMAYSRYRYMFCTAFRVRGSWQVLPAI